MKIRSITAGLVKASLVFVIAGAAAYTGYQYGTEKGREKCGQAFEVALVDHSLQESVEARHDRGLVELLHQKRTDDAFRLAQARYFSRVLLLPEMARATKNQVIHRDVGAELIEAKFLSVQTSFKFNSESDEKAWEGLIRTIPEKRLLENPVQQNLIQPALTRAK